MVMSIFSMPFLRQVGVGVLLVLDALLDILVVEVEVRHAVVGAEALVVVGDDALQGLLLGIGILLVVFLFLGQVLLELPHVGAYIGRGREDGGDSEGNEGRVASPPLGLGLLE